MMGKLHLDLMFQDHYGEHTKQTHSSLNLFDMDHITLSAGDTSVPGKALQPDFETGDYMNCDTTLFFSMGFMYQDEENNIDREKHNRGYTFICSDLEEGTGYEILRKTGTVLLEVQFAQFHLRCTSKIIDRNCEHCCA